MSKVKEIYAHHDVLDHEIDLYAKTIGIPSPLLEIALSNASSSLGDPNIGASAHPKGDQQKDKTDLTDSTQTNQTLKGA